MVFGSRNTRFRISSLVNKIQLTTDSFRPSEEQSDPERENVWPTCVPNSKRLGCQLNLAKELSDDAEGHRLDLPDYVSGKISESYDNEIELDNAEK